MMKMLGMILMLIVNPRVGWNMEEVARLVAAYRLILLTSLPQWKLGLSQGH